MIRKICRRTCTKGTEPQSERKMTQRNGLCKRNCTKGTEPQSVRTENDPTERAATRRTEHQPNGPGSDPPHPKERMKCTNATDRVVLHHKRTSAGFKIFVQQPHATTGWCVKTYVRIHMKSSYCDMGHMMHEKINCTHLTPSR